MGLDAAAGDADPVGDFVVVEALGDEPEDLQLPRGERRQLPLLT